MQAMQAFVTIICAIVIVGSIATLSALITDIICGYIKEREGKK